MLYSLCNKIPSTAVPNLFELLTKQSALLSICNILFPPTQSFSMTIALLTKKSSLLLFLLSVLWNAIDFLYQLLPRHAKRCKGRAMQSVAMWRFLQFVVYASLILDRLTFHANKDFNSINCPDKPTKQSRDLKCVYVFIHDTFI